jgi:hypothetical protein
LTDAQDDLAQDVSGLDTLLGFRGVCKGKFRGNRHLEVSLLDSLIQALVLSRAWNGVVGDGG